MALTNEQLGNAHRIFDLATQAGLGEGRAWELVGASYRESGLRETSVNSSSGAFGLFQLLSPGYVAKYRQLLAQGEDAASANIDAILPNYVTYWRNYPNAVVGQGAAAVEASGEPASWYAAGIKDVVTQAGSDLSKISQKGGPSPFDVGANLGAGYSAIGSAVTGPINSVEKALKFLFSYRFLEIVGGLALIGIGVYALTREKSVTQVIAQVTPAAPQSSYGRPASEGTGRRRTRSYTLEADRKPERGSPGSSQLSQGDTVPF